VSSLQCAVATFATFVSHRLFVSFVINFLTNFLYHVLHAAYINYPFLPASSVELMANYSAQARAQEKPITTKYYYTIRE
jgi:hypothetical protein